MGFPVWGKIVETPGLQGVIYIYTFHLDQIPPLLLD